MQTMEFDRNGLEVLDRRESLRLLATGTIGRIGLTSRALPLVLPVNYRLVADRVVIRTGRGSKLEAAACDAVVAFEVDAFDAFSHCGWSVMVTGMAREVADPAARRKLLAAGVARWAPFGEEAVIAIDTELISGRRLVHDAQAVADIS